MKKCLIILFVLIFSVGIAYTKDIEDKEQKAAVGFFFFGLKRFVETIKSPAVKNDKFYYGIKNYMLRSMIDLHFIRQQKYMI